MLCIQYIDDVLSHQFLSSARLAAVCFMWNSVSRAEAKWNESRRIFRFRSVTNASINESNRDESEIKYKMLHENDQKQRRIFRSLANDALLFVFFPLCVSLDIFNDSRPITGAIFLFLIILAFAFFGSGVKRRERFFSDKCCIAHLLLLGSFFARFRTMSRRLENGKMSFWAKHFIENKWNDRFSCDI